MVYNTALGLVQNAEDADDVAQEVFVTCFERLKDFKAASSLKTWLYRITVNKSLDHLRKRRRFLGFLQKKEVSPEVDFEHPGVQLDKKEETKQLFAGLNQIPPQQKAALVLQYLEHLSVAEIAQVLEVTESATASLLMRGKQNLRKQLLKN